jgi:hypothetical protein
MSKSAFSLFLLSVLVLSFACVPKRVEVPSYEGKDLHDILSERSAITDIDTVFSIRVETDGTQTRGDAALHVTREGAIALRVYSLGFLALEVETDNGDVRCSEAMSMENKYMLTKGLRDGLFWWDVDGPIAERDGHYTLAGADREVWIDKETFLPARQAIALGGQTLVIRYAAPARSAGGVWYQSKMSMGLGKYRATISIDKMSFATAP